MSVVIPDERARAVHSSTARARVARRLAVEMIHRSGEGHYGGSLSPIDILAVLYEGFVPLNGGPPGSRMYRTGDRVRWRAEGELERRALPVPDQRPEGLAYAPAVTPTQLRLVAIWRSVLRLDQVGVEDNFFELGGHSLLATRVIAQVREQLQIEVSLRLLFEAPTIKRLALRLDLATGEYATSSLRGSHEGVI